MSDRTYRVIVRGSFTDLDETRRAALTAAAGEHDILSAAFTDEGTLIYDGALRNFTFRCVVRQASDANDEAAVQSACERAAATLSERGIQHSPLRGTATSLDDMKIRRPRH